MSGQITFETVAMFRTFDGEIETFDDYLDHFNGILSAFGLNKAKGFRILPLKLKGRALRAYKQAKRSEQMFDYQSLVNGIAKYLATEGSKIKAKYGSSQNMQENETLSDFAERIRRNVVTAYPNFVPTHQESVMADKFVLGLVDHLREKVMTETYLTLSEALDKAEYYSVVCQMKKTENLENKIDELTKALQNSSLSGVNFVRSQHFSHANSHQGKWERGEEFLPARQRMDGDYPEWEQDWYEPDGSYEQYEQDMRGDYSGEHQDRYNDPENLEYPENSFASGNHNYDYGNYNQRY